jgi:hypothetical protein
MSSTVLSAAPSLPKTPAALPMMRERRDYASRRFGSGFVGPDSGGLGVARAGAPDLERGLARADEAEARDIDRRG